MRMALRAAVACLAIIGTANADDVRASIKQQISIPPQSLGSALQALAKKRDFQIVYMAELESLPTNGASGELTIEETLRRLLEGTGHTFRYSDEKTVTIVPMATAPAIKKDDTASKGKKPQQSRSFWDRLRVAQVDASPTEEKKEAESVTLEQVVVTATKRLQSVQDVPMSITAIGSEDIERRGYLGMADYLSTTPGVSHIDLGVGSNAIVIRGVSVDPINEQFAAGATVGAYFGEIPLSGLRASGPPDIKLVDMERIEILRGPQGTLYGSGSIGGTVRNIPMAPSLDRFEGSAKMSYSQTGEEGGDNTLIQGVVNIPLITDKLALRGVAYRSKDSGFINNVAGSDPSFQSKIAPWGVSRLAVDRAHMGAAEYTGGRLAAFWKVTDRFDATLTYVRQKAEQEGQPQIQPELGAFAQTRLQVNEGQSDDTEIVNLVLEYDLSVGSLLWSTSRTDQKWQRTLDLGEFFWDVGFPVPSTYDQQSKGFTSELRFASDFSGPVQVLSGLYYEDLEFPNSQDSYYAGSVFPHPYGNDTLLVASDRRETQRQVALFGEIDYEITSKLTATGGARVFKYDRKREATLSGVFGTSNDVTANDAKDELFKVGLKYQMQDDKLVYAQWTQGFRLASSRIALTSNCDANSDGFVDGLNGIPMNYDLNSDNTDNYELGTKMTFRDRHLTVNASVFRVDWQGIPVLVQPTCGISFPVNAGEARSQGVEFESVYRFRNGVRVGLGTSYTDAELTKSASNLGSKGDRLPGSPKFIASARLDYDFDVAGRPGFVGMTYSHVGGYYDNLQEAGPELAGYQQLNLRAGLTFGNLNAEAFVNNATNSDDLVYRFFPRNSVYRLRPRTIGISLGLRF